MTDSTVADMKANPHFTNGYVAQQLHEALEAMKSIKRPSDKVRAAILNSERTLAFYKLAHPTSRVGA